mgnify:CR=1 FL=1
MTNEMLLLNKLDKDIEWFKENQTELEERYNNNFIAIENEKVINNDKNLDHLLTKLKEIGKDPAEVLIKFVSATVVIL